MIFIKAFIVGGILSVIGQILIDKTKATAARILTGYVIAGIVLSMFGIYEKLVSFAGAGATVPLTGFGALLAKGVRGAVEEEGILGALTGGFAAAGAGIALVIILSVIAAMLCKSKDKS